MLRIRSHHVVQGAAFFLTALFLLFAAASVFRAGGIRHEEIPPKPEAGKEQLVIATIPERNVFEMRKQYQAVSDYLSNELGISIKLKTLANYKAVIEEFQNGDSDAAFLGSFDYVVAHLLNGAEVVARPELLDGASTYKGLIFVRSDSDIHTPEQMKGKTLVLVDRYTTAGYLFPLKYFKENGIENPESFFKKVYFAGSHDAAVIAVLQGEADVGACKDTVYRQLEGELEGLSGKLTILTSGREVPSNAFVVNGSMNPHMRERIEQALLAMDRTADGKRALEKFRARRFLHTTDADYAGVNELVEFLGLDLRAFQ